MAGADLPEERKDEVGYLSINQEGHTMWTPKEQFETSNMPANQMNFSLMLQALLKGHKVARKGWNGKNMFLVYVPGSVSVKMQENTVYHNALAPEVTGQTHVDINPHIDMMTASGEFQPGWLASQTDIFAVDWCIVE